MPPKPNTCTIADAAAALHVSAVRITQMVNEGRLIAIRWPGHVLVLRSSLDALVKERRKPTRAALFSEPLPASAKARRLTACASEAALASKH